MSQPRDMRTLSIYNPIPTASQVDMKAGQHGTGLRLQLRMPPRKKPAKKAALRGFREITNYGSGVHDVAD